MSAKKNYRDIAYWKYGMITSSSGMGWMSVHEIYYDSNDVPHTWTEDPIDIGAESYEDFVTFMANVMRDVASSPLYRVEGNELVVEAPVGWAGIQP